MAAAEPEHEALHQKPLWHPPHVGYGPALSGRPHSPGQVAQRQGISVKYLEQIIIPLKKADYIQSVRGPKGGHTLARPPEEITVGEIVALLEEGTSLAECSR